VEIDCRTPLDEQKRAPDKGAGGAPGVGPRGGGHREDLSSYLKNGPKAVKNLNGSNTKTGGGGVEKSNFRGKLSSGFGKVCYFHSLGVWKGTLGKEISDSSSSDDFKK